MIDPIFDTSDVAAIAALPVREILRDWHFPTPFEEMGEWTIAVRLAEWLVQARALAASGVRPGPSHMDDSHTQPSVWGGFENALDVIPVSPSSPSAPQVVLGYEVQLFSFRTVVSDVLHYKEFDPLAGRSFTYDEIASFLPNDELWYQRPVLPLNTASAFSAFRALGFSPRALGVQTAGMMCDHRYIVGVPLPLTAVGALLATCVGRFLKGSSHRCVRRGNAQEPLWEEYRDLTASLGLSASSTLALLEEGFLPLDQSCLTALTALPASLALPEPIHQPGLPSHLMSSPGIFVLPGNCD